MATNSMQARIQVAIIGYGAAGKVFHAPIISGVRGLQLACICTSKADVVHADWPQVRTVPTPEGVWRDASIDLVVIASPTNTHHALAKAALLAGKHVVIDKPCTVTLAETAHLLAVAKAQQRTLTVFQNRRFDADFLALQQVLASGQLGRIVHFESHFDRYRVVLPSKWREQDIPGSDLWLDLGAHLVDQALQLFGVPDDIMLDLAQQRDNTLTNDYFHAQLRYPSQPNTTQSSLRVVLHASSCVTTSGPRFSVHGIQGSFTKYGLDVQEDALKAGARPQLNNLGDWGRDPLVGTIALQPSGGPANWSASLAAPDVPGNYLQYYVQLRDHLLGQGSAPVTAQQVHQVMAMLSRGEQSAREGRFVATADLVDG